MKFHMRFFFFLKLPLLLLLFSATSGKAEVKDYSQTINLLKETPVIASYFKDAYGYALFPTIGKGGIGIGGAYGKGQVYRDSTVTGTVQMFQASVGFQLGGQAYSQIIFFQDKRAYIEFTSGSFEFDATASAMLITAGARPKLEQRVQLPVQVQGLNLLSKPKHFITREW